MELEQLLEREPWTQALDLLKQWQALPLLDVQLQNDLLLMERMRWARRLGLPLMPSLLLGAADPVVVAERLGIQEAKAVAAAVRCHSRLADRDVPTFRCQPIDLVDRS